MTLPISFDSNTFQQMMTFLNESNRIEGIEKVDYLKQTNFQTPESGHFGALVLSQNQAIEHEPLTIRTIKNWQALITREQIYLGEEIDSNEIGHIRSPSLQKNVRIGKHVPPSYNHVPTLLDALLEQINEGLKDQEKLKDDAEYCKFLGRSFQEFESIHPFADGNGRTGRLMANYIATYCNRPIIVFSSELTQRNAYIRAHDSKEKMIVFMANKIQEAIFGTDQKIFFKENSPESTTGIYRSLDGNCEKYEWHLLKRITSPKQSEFQENL